MTDMLEKMLDTTEHECENETWCKLNRSTKGLKFQKYIQMYSETNNLSEDEQQKLAVFLNDCLDRKKLCRMKDVVYDKNSGTIINIPSLTFHRLKGHFTLKNTDKRDSTLKSLKRPSIVRTKKIKDDISVTK